AEAATQICCNYLAQLKTLVQECGFAGQAHEIQFFKHTKPQFLGPFIYYTGLFNLFSHWPEGSKILQDEYLNLELRRLKQFFTDHQHFYFYYKTGSTYLDDKYFVRGNFDIRLMQDCFYFEADTTFSTGYDFIFSRLVANQ